MNISDKFKNITKLISECGWNIGIWQKRYGSGFYGMISRQNFISEIEDILTGSDIEATELETYLWDQGHWLPISSGDSISDVMDNLENKIREFSNSDIWINKALDVFEKIIDENDGSYGIRIAIDNDKEDFFNWVD